MRDPHRMVFPATPRGAAQYALNYGWETASLHGESSRLLNVNAYCGNPTQVGYPSVYQGFPLTADLLLRWLGGGVYPAGWGVANVLAIYACDTASPLVDSLGLGPNLVAAGGPLTGRECIGLGQVGSWTSKVGVEIIGGLQRFSDAGVAFGDVNGTTLSFLIVLRIREICTGNCTVLGKQTGPGVGWSLLSQGAGAVDMFINGNTYSAVASAIDASWHCFAAYVNDALRTTQLYSDLGDGIVGNYIGSATNANAFTLGIGSFASFLGSVAYLAVFDLALTSAMRAAFWRHAQVPVPYLHARLNPLVCPISASRVACYSGGNVGQAAVGYDASLVSAALGNPLGNGYVADAGATFEPIGSTDVYGLGGTVGATVRAAVDGPSGMRDGMRVTMGAGWVAAFAVSPAAPGVAIVGVSNIPWRADVNYRRAAVNTTARFGLYYSGSGGGPEFATFIADAASPVDWTRGGGTFTPVNADQTAVYVAYGAALAADDCDFGEPFLIKNRTTAPLAWRRVGIVAAAVTSAPSIQVVNAGNYVYNPLRGEYRRTFAGFPGTAGATLFQFGAAGAAGSMTADYNAGQLRWRGWNSAGALAWTVLCGAIGTGKYQLVFQWDSTAPLRTIGGAYVAVTDVNPAAPVILGTWLAPWTAQPAAVTPLYLLTDAAAANPWRGFHEEA